MQKIPIFLAKPGMKLAQEVKDVQGRVLCGPGVELDQDLIERFERMEVKFLLVEGHPVQFPWERPLEEELKALEERFSRVAQDEQLQMLKEVIRAFWLRQKGEGSA